MATDFDPSSLQPGPVAPPMPDVSAMPPTSNAAPAPAPAPVAPPDANVSHNVLGRAVRHIASALEGKQVSYVPDSTTGTYQEVVTPRKPGGIFRDILMGAVIGGAAGAQGDPRQGFVGGFARGGSAEIGAQQRQAVDQRNDAGAKAEVLKRNRDAKEAKQTADDQAAASLAAHSISTLDQDHHANLYDSKQIQSHNNSHQLLMQTALDNGGSMPQIMGQDGKDLNGETDNGGKLMELFNKDPQSLMAAPEGFHRTPFTQIDTAGLEHKSGKWIDTKTGKEVDLADRTTFHLVDVPTNAWNRSLTMTKGTVNDVAGRTVAQGSPTDSVSTSFGSIFGLGLKQMKDRASERNELYRAPKDDKEAAGWVAAGKNIPPDATEDEKKQFAIKSKIGSDYLGASADQAQAKKSPTATTDKLQTRELVKKMNDGTLSDDERKDLIARQQEEAIKGVPADIVASIGPRPVPAQYAKGENDPAYRAAEKMWGDKSVSKKAALQAASGLARYQMLGDIRDYNVVDTTTGQMTRMTANQLKNAPGSTILATQDGTKVMGKQAAIGDIQYNLDNTKKTIGALDNLDLGTRAKLAVALRSPDPESALKTLQTSEARALSDPKMQDAIIALTSLAENIMLLRSVQGVGGAGSDMMRHALMDLAPSATSPDKRYAGKQLDVLQGTLNKLKTGVPSLGNTNQSQPLQNNQPAPQTHAWSASAFQTEIPESLCC
jgi:hypothetical protein